MTLNDNGMANENNTYVISRQVLDKMGKALKAPHEIILAIRPLLESQSKEAFKLQAFGEIQWAQRYPNMKTPPMWINIAGAVQDLSEAPRIRPQRFDPRPALLGTTGILRKSVHADIQGDSVVLGAGAQYANIHQQGGHTQRQPITATIKENLKKLLKFGPTSSGRKRGKVSDKTKELRARLGFLFGIKELKTTPGKRPFIGLTDKTKWKINDVIEKTFGAAGFEKA